MHSYQRICPMVSLGLMQKVCYDIMGEESATSSLIPRPTPVLRLALTIIHGCRRAKKNRKGLVSFMTRVMSGGHGGGGGGGGA